MLRRFPESQPAGTRLVYLQTPAFQGGKYPAVNCNRSRLRARGPDQEVPGAKRLGRARHQPAFLRDPYPHDSSKHCGRPTSDPATPWMAADCKGINCPANFLLN